MAYNTTINNTTLNLENAAAFLGISTATVRNWVKCGRLRTIDKDANDFFCLNEVKSIKMKIASGDIGRLNKRANKTTANRAFVPNEYLADKKNLACWNEIIHFIKDNPLDLSVILLLVSLNVLKKESLLFHISIDDLVERKPLFISNDQLQTEMQSWLSGTPLERIKESHTFLLECPLPEQRDILGCLYQSLQVEGKKSQNGSYYTPSYIVDEIVRDHVKRDSKVLDPCCGTGQFLLAFSETIENPSNIYGVDIDPIAVRIARLNLLIKYKNHRFVPKITCKNALLDIGGYDLFNANDETIKEFDVIATNPPWGVHFPKDILKKLRTDYPEISSLESFSYFLKKGIALLKDGGIASFILPESILNVKTHRDIRDLILKNTHVEKIVYLNRVFKNVFTSVIRLDLKKGQAAGGDTEICRDECICRINPLRWKANPDFIFDIHVNNADSEIISRIYECPHTTLERNAEWALGIVTGDNEKYVINTPRAGFEEVYKGKDVAPFALKNPTSYIRFVPESFQQVAPIEKYRSREKLIYRFISKGLVFAYDDRQKLTLNSANIVIPMVRNYPIKVIAALFNSSLYQFLFQKKFSSIKVLRSHIEQLPLPLWGKKEMDEIVNRVDKIIKKQGDVEALDNYIMRLYGLSTNEIDYIRNAIN